MAGIVRLYIASQAVLLRELVMRAVSFFNPVSRVPVCVRSLG